MDRWLCAFLSGYGLTFWFRRPADETTLLSLAVLTCTCLLLDHCTHLRTQLLGGVLCGILWGAGNAYFVMQTPVPERLFTGTVNLELQISEVVARQPGVWRITGRVKRWPASAQFDHTVRLRLHWYDPHSAAPQRLPLVGETWHFSTRLKAPQGTRNAGSMFYHRYLLANEIAALGTIRRGHYLSGQASPRQQLVQRLERALANVPLSGVLLALLVGERHGLSSEQWQVVQRTGLAHLLAISGMHLSLVTGLAFVLAWRVVGLLSRRRSQRERRNLWHITPWLALPLALLYAWLAGFAIATLRALIMLAVVWWHKVNAWRISAARVLLRAVAVVIVLQPLAPLSTGFWLSVGAVASILLMTWRWPRYHGRWAKVRELWRFEWLITLLFLPVMLASFGGASSAAALTNLVVVPIVSLWVLPIALLGFIAAALQWYGWAQPLLQLASWPLATLWPQLEVLAVAPWQWLPASRLPSWPWILAILLVVLLPMGWRWRAAGTGILLFALLVTAQLPNGPRLSVHMLDVEQGTALVIERQGHALLIDTAASWDSSGAMASRTILPFLQQRRLSPELAFITHTDRDHEGGYVTLAQAFRELRWYGGSYGAPCLAGQRGRWREVSWQVLHPRDDQRRGNAHNNSSCVLLLQFEQLRILVTGDVEKAVERKLLAELAPVRAHLLVVPHHGSKSSSEDYFIQHVQPSVALLSRGRNSAYGHPHPEVVATYARQRIALFDTAVGGQISIHTDGRRWWAEQPFAAAQGYWFDRDQQRLKSTSTAETSQ
ncbi:DNA internalization-related competence protein ComEC/Rec2 [Pseudidiomarina insulisalsae]|uniref:DNA internalization-related competence protein ComEC/Rec2 n=1 Tax=Pseudidiomarina insulisalsae TaxID=575789 RepID=A0A432YMJ9_9GAMM|nr:DNA internalization-related competence protein ComEC/Rec2 [Pseudidiomarina insulisalsae]RUO62118.1 DNA internalization-related competence protein ComEC/Rec2 [Pseudidiomarina insulisalsae]